MAKSQSQPNAAPSYQPSEWIDPQALMRVKNLQWRAKSVVDGFHNGLHRSPNHGFSVEFSEYRPYTPGDDPRSIDWKLYARSDRYYLKKYEDETNRRCQLIVDQSKSMTYGSIGYSKAEYARTLAATLAYYFTLQRDAVGMVTFESQVTGRVPARFRSGQLKRLFALLETPSQGSGTDLKQPLNQIAEILHQRSLILVLSDFLVPVPTFAASLTYLRARRHEVVLMRIIDPAEKNLRLEQPTMVRDLESGREMYIDPATARDRYLERFQAHQRELTDLAGRLGIACLTLDTDQPLELALFDMLSHQQRHASRQSLAPASASSSNATPRGGA